MIGHSDLKKVLFNVQLILPVLIVCFSVIESFETESLWTSREQIYWRFFTNIVLINSLHTGLMFVFMATLPAYRNWYKDYSRHSWRPIVRWSLFFILMIFILSTKRIDYYYFDDLIRTWLVLYVTHHSLKQSVGISLLINRSRFLKSKEQNKRMEDIERFIIWFLLMGKIIPLLAEESVLSWIDVSYLKIKFFSTIVMVVPVVYLIFQSLLSTSEGKWLKSIYFCRYFLYPLSLFSFLGSVGIGMIHGAEYLFFAHHLSSPKRSESVVWDKLSYASLFLFLIVFVLSFLSEDSGILQLFMSDEAGFAIIGQYGAILLTAIAYLHFYIEGGMYRFSQEPARTHLLPLLRKL